MAANDDEVIMQPMRLTNSLDSALNTPSGPCLERDNEKIEYVFLSFEDIGPPGDGGLTIKVRIAKLSQMLTGLQASSSRHRDWTRSRQQ